MGGQIIFFRTSVLGMGLVYLSEPQIFTKGNNTIFSGIDSALRPVNSYTLQVMSTDSPHVKIMFAYPNIIAVANAAITEPMLVRANFFYFLDN